MFMNDDLIQMEKKVLLAYFKVLIFARRNWGNPQNLS